MGGSETPIQFLGSTLSSKLILNEIGTRSNNNKKKKDILSLYP